MTLTWTWHEPDITLTWSWHDPNITLIRPRLSQELKSSKSRIFLKFLNFLTTTMTTTTQKRDWETTRSSYATRRLKRWQVFITLFLVLYLKLCNTNMVDLMVFKISYQSLFRFQKQPHSSIVFWKVFIIFRLLFENRFRLVFGHHSRSTVQKCSDVGIF